jgi:hypothetical protein
MLSGSLLKMLIGIEKKTVPKKERLIADHASNQPQK